MIGNSPVLKYLLGSMLKNMALYAYKAPMLKIYWW